MAADCFLILSCDISGSPLRCHRFPPYHGSHLFRETFVCRSKPPSRAERKIHLPVSACVPLAPQNIPECNYDGGDCCSCTCEDTPNQECGRWGGFACIDPSAACVNDDDITVDMLDVCDYVGGIGESRATPFCFFCVRKGLIAT